MPEQDITAENEPQANEEDHFAGAAPLPGLEHLGRAIVDASGAPSGSPANFEELRGAPHDAGWSAVAAEAVVDTEAMLAQLRAEHPPQS